MDPIERFLADYPDRIRAIADDLRALVRESVPGAVERIRPGWRLIGYDVPVGRGQRYFAYVAPESEHVHLGFEYGALLHDPEQMLHGAELRLRQVRYLTFRPGQSLARDPIIDLVRQAARVIRLTRAERSSLALLHDSSWGPPTVA